jgi:hypothetical protein
MWVKDAGQTLVVKESEGRWWWLRGAEATAWDLLQLGYDTRRVAAHLGILLECSTQDAQELLDDMVSSWERDGLIVVARGGARG